MNHLESELQRKQEVYIKSFHSKACSCKIVKYFLMKIGLCKDRIQLLGWKKNVFGINKCNEPPQT